MYFVKLSEKENRAREDQSMRTKEKKHFVRAESKENPKVKPNGQAKVKPKMKPKVSAKVEKSIMIPKASKVQKPAVSNVQSKKQKQTKHKPPESIDKIAQETEQRIKEELLSKKLKTKEQRLGQASVWTSPKLELSSLHKKKSLFVCGSKEEKFLSDLEVWLRELYILYLR